MEATIDKSAELSKLLSHLKEYTEKLRKINEAKRSEELLKTKIKAMSWVSFVIVVVMAYGSLMASVGNAAYYRYFIALFAMSAVVFTFSQVQLWYFSYVGQKRYYSIEADVTATTVLKLSRIISQYNEQAGRKLGLDLEYELRVAEADGALSFYREVFNKEVPAEKYDFDFEKNLRPRNEPYQAPR